MLQQITAVLENKPGRLSGILKTLSEGEIDINGISIADSVDYGLCRMILSDPEKGRRLLSSAGFIVQSTEVMALEVSDNPGSLQQVLETFSLAGINIQYVYAFGTKLSEKAMIILKPDDLHQAEKLCLQAGAKSLSPKDVEARLTK